MRARASVSTSSHGRPAAREHGQGSKGDALLVGDGDATPGLLEADDEPYEARAGAELEDLLAGDEVGLRLEHVQQVLAQDLKRTRSSGPASACWARGRAGPQTRWGGLLTVPAGQTMPPQPGLASTLSWHGRGRVGNEISDVWWWTVARCSGAEPLA